MSYIRKEVEAVNVNPWAGDLSLSLRKGEKTVVMGKGNAIVNTETGEMGEEIAAMAIKKVVDKEEFIKIFEGGISNIFDLNKQGRDFFRAVLAVYLDQKMMGDRVYLNRVVLEEFGYIKSNQTYRQSLNILLNKKFLAEMAGMPGWFWVNPNLFYKGDRMRIVQDFAIKDTESGKQLEKEQREIDNVSRQKSLGLGE